MKNLSFGLDLLSNLEDSSQSSLGLDSSALLGIDMEQVAIHWETAEGYPLRVTEYLKQKGWEMRC